jgi:hypothetical protein
MKKITPKTTIPVCKSEYLQDITIALGTKLKSPKKNNKSIIITASTNDLAEDSKESLIIEASSYLGDLTKFVIWEDGFGWVYRRSKLNNRFCSSEFNFDLREASTYQLAMLISQSMVDWQKNEISWSKYLLT